MYGERRKRNLSLLRDDQTNNSKRLLTDEDDWNEELEEGYEEMEVYDEEEQESDHIETKPSFST
ncbi:hypothetical protein ACQKL5_15730 [Peribacillus sp. NPDC097675]|uniref:hypothetical protein n=1 Tax=Peribacillus sp. NPDC097675 TaxID=3390618 RepID=UPI003D03C60C